MTARIVYTDLDGTMVGPRGSFWHTAGRELTDDPAAALLDLHRAGVPLVLVSGRTFEQVVEAARIFAADGAIAELGATSAWDGGRDVHRLRRRVPRRVRRPDADGRHGSSSASSRSCSPSTPAGWSGTPPGTPPTTTDALLRGRVDPLAVDAWLTEQGLGWLTLKDNGAIPATSRMTAGPTTRVPPRVYHLMPRGHLQGRGDRLGPGAARHLPRPTPSRSATA